MSLKKEEGIVTGDLGQMGLGSLAYCKCTCASSLAIINIPPFSPVKVVSNGKSVVFTASIAFSGTTILSGGSGGGGGGCGGSSILGGGGPMFIYHKKAKAT